MNLAKEPARFRDPWRPLSVFHRSFVSKHFRVVWPEIVLLCGFRLTSVTRTVFSEHILRRSALIIRFSSFRREVFFILA